MLFQKNIEPRCLRSDMTLSSGYPKSLWWPTSPI